MKIVTFCTTL